HQPRLGQALRMLVREGGVYVGVGDAGTPAGERLELPAPLVAGRLLPLRRGTPGDLPPLAEGDDMVVAHPAVAVRHHEHVADGADSLPGRGLGEIVVAVPAWLLGGIGDEGEERVRRDGGLAGGGDDAVAVRGHAPILAHGST